jgi:gamma-glutamyl-gamma-aminobutyrate hydrolase PuuD
MSAVIAISAYTVDSVRNWPNGAHALHAEYSRAVLGAGATPVLVPPGVVDAMAVIDRVDALILAGGGDVAPDRYGAEAVPEIEYLDPERDDTEFALFHAAWSRRLPTLAICRGMQVVNLALGGTIVQHIPGDSHRNAAEHLPIEHSVRVAGGSRLASIVGEEVEAVASLHHQAVDLVADALTPVAWAPDEVIEGLEASGRWFIAVQWHPETAAAHDATHRALFQALAAQAAT